MAVRGFFHGSQLAQIKQPMSMVPKCGSCGFYKECESPKMKPEGRGRKSILIVSSFPGIEEDNRGKQLIGNASREVQRALAKHNVDIKSDCVLTNALICRPPVKGKELLTDKVTNNHVEWCRPNLIKTIKEMDPSVIILIGQEATTSVIGWLWKQNPGAIGKWAGWTIPSQELNAWICPTYNPTYVLRELQGKYKNPIPRLLYERHLGQAVALAGTRPWEEVPNWCDDVEIVYDTDRAAKILRRMISKGGSVAVDYECNMLKPEGEDAQIVSCAVCWNDKKTIAYPWTGAAVEATRELWRSPLPKIAANAKFEDRWTRKHLKTATRNWYFDTMLGAHAIDSREGTKSLKFQSFVELGMGDYNDHIEQFLGSKSSMEKNKIDTEIKLSDLLLYNGLDAMLEYKLARVQMQKIGYPFPEGMK